MKLHSTRTCSDLATTVARGQRIDHLEGHLVHLVFWLATALFTLIVVVSVVALQSLEPCELGGSQLRLVRVALVALVAHRCVCDRKEQSSSPRQTAQSNRAEL